MGIASRVGHRADELSQGTIGVRFERGGVTSLPAELLGAGQGLDACFPYLTCE